MKPARLRNGRKEVMGKKEEGIRVMGREKGGSKDGKRGGGIWLFL